MMVADIMDVLNDLMDKAQTQPDETRHAGSNAALKFSVLMQSLVSCARCPLHRVCAESPWTRCSLEPCLEAAHDLSMSARFVVHDAERADSRDFTGLVKASGVDKVTNTSEHTVTLSSAVCGFWQSVRINVVKDIRSATV